jgi:hypothetical protein
VPAHAQDSLLLADSQRTNDLLRPNAVVIPVQERFTTVFPSANAMFSSVTSQPLPDKPQPIAHVNQWIAEGEVMPILSNNLVIVAKKGDGTMMWHVEEVDSCTWCGKPMTWREAAFDKQASSMWILRSALVVADVEITHHLPCFEAGTCREWNPLLGQTRLQGYSVAAGLTAIAWISDAWLRKGNKEYRIGGYRHWWIIPAIGYAASAVGIASNLARWHSR